MPSIQLLSDETIDQIAAGEVIGSPANVIKELVENALDAEASKILIEIREGGLESIRITDDGKGMDAEDARLSVLRHATSKLRHFKELFSLSTMGFRGEALASIAAISRLTLLTCEGDQATHLEYEAGVLKKEKRAARARGTTIEVRDLFFNVPARKKFQKTPAALSAEVFRLITQLALGAPAIHFELITNGRKALQVPASSSIRERAALLMGDEFIQEALPIEYAQDPFKMTGLIGAPQQARANRLGQYLYVNRRPVFCPVINFAIRDGYGTRLEEKRHPSYLLHVEIPFELVDVNVHPQKSEVRLREERLLKQRIQQAVEQAFVSTAPASTAVRFDFEPSSSPFFFASAQMAQEPVQMQPAPQLPFPVEDLPEPLGLIGPFWIQKGSLENPGEEGISIIDLRRVAARLIYDQLTKRSGPIEKQGLLLPYTLELTSVETTLVLSHLDTMEEIGLVLRPAGKELFLVEALPPYLDLADVKPLVMGLCQQLQEWIGKPLLPDQRNEALAKVASRFAKIQKSFNLEEARRWIEALALSKDSNRCPLGRPIAVQMGVNAIESLFSR